MEKKKKAFKKLITLLFSNRTLILTIIPLTIICSAFFLWQNRHTPNAKAATCDGIWCDPNNSAASENTDVVIDGETVTISGHHTFKSLTIKNNGILTHASLNASDINTTLPSSDPNYYLPSGQQKAVNLDITGDLTLESGGKIDVTGQGLPGGQPSKDGTGPGKSKGTYIETAARAYNHTSSGGAGFMGKGGDGVDLPKPNWWTTVTTNKSNGGTVYAQTPAPLVHAGSGGGGAQVQNRPRWRGPLADLSTANGGSGGGRIYLNIAGTLQVLDKNSFISANGKDAATTLTSPDATSMAFAGGGSGGSIYIKTDKILYKVDNYNPVSYVGGQGGANGAPGLYSPINHGSGGSTFYNLFASGGSSNVQQIIDWRRRTVNYSYGGGGSGGYISVETNSIIHDCTILYGDQIPDFCENQKVIIRGTTVDISLVPVWQSTIPAKSQVKGVACSDQNDTNCDTHRTFINLTVQNNGKIIHSAVTVAEMDNENLTNPMEDSLADETKGTARWKKVDITVNKIPSDPNTGIISLGSNGSIDVSEKGYPGGWAEGANKHQKGFGPGGGGGLPCGLAVEDREPSGAGGGYGGKGGNGIGRQRGNIGDEPPWEHTLGGHSYPTGTYDPTDSKQFEWGSGGGGTGLCGSGLVPNGARGGGRIHLTAPVLDNTIGSKISADGGNGYCSNGTQSRRPCSGAGSGGTVWIQAPEITHLASAVPNPQNVNAGTTSWTSLTRDYYPCLPSSIYPVGCQSWQPFDPAIDGYIIGNPGYLIPANTNPLGVTAKGGDALMSYIDGTEPFHGGPKHSGGTGGGGRVIVDTSPLPPLATPGNIKGDVYAPNVSDLHGFTIEPGAIVAGNSVDETKIGPIIKCSPTVTTNCVKIIKPYPSLQWDYINKSTFSSIVNKAYDITTQLVGPTNSSLPNPFNLNSNTADPSGSGNKNPEGGIWKIIADSGTVDANLPVDPPTAPPTYIPFTYTNRGTIIIVGDLDITGDIIESAGSNGALGLIVTGDVTIEKTAAHVHAAIYSQGKITVADRDWRNGLNPTLDFQGFMVAEGSISLPTNPYGSTFTYNPFLSTSSKRSLPGFTSIQQMIISNVAP